MKNKYYKTHLIILFLISIYSVGINAQKKETIIPFDNKKQYYFFASTEVFLLDASLQFGLNIDNRFLIGLEGNFGLNSSN